MKYEVGEIVICIREDNIPSFVGTLWIVVGTLGDLCMCMNKTLDTEHYPFKFYEIAPASPLLKELF